MKKLILLLPILVLISCTTQTKTEIIASARPLTEVCLYNDIRISVVYTVTVARHTEIYDEVPFTKDRTIAITDEGIKQALKERRKRVVIKVETNVNFEYILCASFTRKWIASRTVYEGSTEMGNFKPRPTDYMGCGAPMEMWTYHSLNNDPFDTWNRVEGNTTRLTLQEWLMLRHKAEQVAIETVRTNGIELGVKK